MNYIILINCKDPYQAKPFKNIGETENMVYSSSQEAEQVASVLRRECGAGEVRVVAL
tara:strand:- start:42 stop:212 length:171 start_codon:yes stop_codon:yes gene_type:complete